ncbi:MAG: cytochrome c4 [Rhodocyclaceae bacterium]|nr:cytochrome c4 [Rhodocyclaceae bacterium]
MEMIRAIAFALMCSVSALAIAQESKPVAPPAAATDAPAIAKNVCAACHGVDGNSAIPANPNLAGQHASYLVKQLKNFKTSPDGKPPLRQNAVMNGMAAPLTDDDIKTLAAYFSKQTLTPAVAKDEKLAVEGRKLWRAGDAKKGIPACAGCHGVAGAGLPAQYPALAGQHPDYTISQLQQFRDGVRANDPEAMMRTIAAKMTDKQMSAVAEYAAGLRQ